MERCIRVYRSFEEAEQANLEEWLAIPNQERLQIGESFREQEFPDYETGLERVLRVAERE